ncbi:hypothetical protein GQX74_013227 [Glossina fuscipes]|nr:hypothetical protein GQX74_013227 [Glossina fuscipes]
MVDWKRKSEISIKLLYLNTVSRLHFSSFPYHHSCFLWQHMYDAFHGTCLLLLLSLWLVAVLFKSFPSLSSNAKIILPNPSAISKRSLFLSTIITFEAPIVWQTIDVAKPIGPLPTISTFEFSLTLALRAPATPTFNDSQRAPSSISGANFSRIGTLLFTDN